MQAEVVVARLAQMATVAMVAATAVFLRMEEEVVVAMVAAATDQTLLLIPEAMVARDRIVPLGEREEPLTLLVAMALTALAAAATGMQRRVKLAPAPEAQVLNGTLLTALVAEAAEGRVLSVAAAQAVLAASMVPVAEAVDGTPKRVARVHREL